MTGIPSQRPPVSRRDGRAPDESRPIQITRGYTSHAPGSVLIATGETRVLCTACVEEGVPRFLQSAGAGWLTAEYRMLPSSTSGRRPRDSARGRIDGRDNEIQRLIGRSLRAVVDRTAWTDLTVWIDCDVLQADGGTRSAAISGAYVAMVDAFRWMQEQDRLKKWPIRSGLAAVSVGVVDGVPLLDLDYSEDSRAEVDLNVVLANAGRFVEIQGTAESAPFDRDRLDRLLALAVSGGERILARQAEALEGAA